MERRGIVLVTRPESEAAETAERLVRMGWQPLICPMLRVEPGRIAELRGRRPQAVLVTSGNALAALPRSLAGTRLLAVGAATAARARAIGFADVLSADGDATDLLDLARNTCPPAAGPLLLAAGEGQGLDLTTKLQDQGFTVVRRIAYRTRPVGALEPSARVALCGGAVQAALFFSAATAAAFHTTAAAENLVPHLAATTAVAISPRTAAALAPLPWRAIRVASAPTQDELLACL